MGDAGEEIALQGRAKDHDGAVEISAEIREIGEALSGEGPHGLVGCGEVEAGRLGEKPMEADALEAGILDLMLQEVARGGGKVRRRGVEGEGGDLDAGVTEGAGVGEGLFKRPVLEGLVADGVLHDGASIAERRGFVDAART